MPLLFQIFNVVSTSPHRLLFISQYIPFMFSITAVHLLSLFITFILAYQFVLSDDLSKISTCPKLICNNVKQNISAQVARNIARAVYKRVPHNHVFDGFPFLYVNPRTKSKAVICFLEKVGSTAWKTLLLKSFDESTFASISPHIAEYKNNFSPKITRDVFEAALKNPDIPRIVFVRNPYSRLLSGYIDKVYNVTDAALRRAYFKGFKAKEKNFGSFVEYVKGVHERDNHPNNTRPPFLNTHYIPQTERCFINAGMRFHYYLKVEQTPIWYPFILKLLGLEKVASSGWDFGKSFRNERSNVTMANTNTSTARNQHQEKSSSSTTTATTSTTTTTSATTIITTTTTLGNTTSTIIITNTTVTNSSSATEAEAIDDGPSDVPTCFYSPPDMSCQDLHKGDDDLTYSTTCEYNTTSDSDHTMLGYNLTLESLLAEGSFVGRSIAAMKTMYTPEIAADTTSFAERDLLMLGYPYWDGNDVMQHVRDLEQMAITANCTDLSLYY